jgi:hypothetical protein
MSIIFSIKKKISYSPQNKTLPVLDFNTYSEFGKKILSSPLEGRRKNILNFGSHVQGSKLEML